MLSRNNFIKIYLKLFSRNCFFISFLFLSFVPLAQDDIEDVMILFEIKKIGNYEVVIMIKGDDIYVPIIETFNIIRIKNKPTASLDTISGWYSYEHKKYLMDLKSGKVFFDEKEFTIDQSLLIKQDEEIYLRSDYFDTIFGLNIDFKFSSLSAIITSDIELPLIREMKLQEMRDNLTSLKRIFKEDTIIEVKRSMFNLPQLNWVLDDTRRQSSNRTSLRVAANGSLFRGNFRASFNYIANQKIIKENQSYIWKYVNDKFKLIRHLSIGKIQAEAYSILPAPVLGGQIGNEKYVKSNWFSNYEINEYLDSGWAIEIYINDKLINYFKTDSSAFFNLKVPVNYGRTNVKMKFFGPNGERKEKQKEMNISYSFLPKNRLLYKMSGGIIEGRKSSLFSRGKMVFGLTKNITLTGGVEHISLPTNTSTLPFLKSDFRVNKSFVFYLDYVYGFKKSLFFNYNLLKNIKLAGSSIIYDRDQKTRINNNRNETKLFLNIPFLIFKKPIQSNLAFDRKTLKRVDENDKSKNAYTTVDASASFNVKRFRFQLKARSFFLNTQSLNHTSSLRTNVVLPYATRLNFMFSYNNSDNELQEFNSGLTKRIGQKSSLNLSYNYNIQNRLQSFSIRLLYNMGAAQISSSVETRSNNSPTYRNTIRSTMVFDNEPSYIKFNSLSNSSKCGMLFKAFLDLNDNGKKDKDEPIIKGLEVEVDGASTKKDGKTVSVSNLSPYKSYFVTLSNPDMEFVSWQIKHKKLKVILNRNGVKSIYVPISIKGEIEGMVYKNKAGRHNGMGRIIVNIFKENKKVASFLTEADGYFSHIGLSPGNYSAKIDETQLRRKKMTTKKPSFDFTIKKAREGDYIDNLKFILVDK